MARKAKPDRATSKTVRNAIELLGCFSRAEPVLTASELARRLKIPRTNVIRLLATLEKSVFVERHRNGAGYKIGIRAFEIGTLYIAGNPIWAKLVEALDKLAEQTQCTPYLATLDKDDVVILTYREGALPIRFIWQVGDRLPCTTTALGKAMLAHLSEREIDAILGKDKPLRTLTGKSLKTRAQLKKGLKQARKLGWALVREESHAGLTAVGAAIIDHSGHPIAAISVSFLDHPANPKRILEYGAMVREAADYVSKQIAGYGHYGATFVRNGAAMPAKK